MDDFEKLLQENELAIERFVRFRINSKEDAEDILQEVYLTAFRSFNQLRNKDSFKPWIISVAKNKCNDYFKRKAKQYEIPIDSLSESNFVIGRQGITTSSFVNETIEQLGDKDKQILYLYYWKELRQEDIAKRLDLPLGTVKSRLHKAKMNFKDKYPANAKGETNMKKMPTLMPNYSIKPIQKEPFAVKWEELMGWFLIPKPNERISWAMYDMPSRECSYLYEMEVTGKAKVHGIEGVEIEAREISCIDKNDVVKSRFIAQLTDTHCRYLATMRNDDDIHNYITFLDGEEFLENWGFGEDNCGNETNLKAKGDIKRIDNEITSVNKDFLLDIVGRYDVTINGKSYDTVCVMDIETYNNSVVSEQFLDRNGRTILWRRYNRDDWAFEHYRKKWSEQLPANDQLVVNGIRYVHWYDCITDYIL